MYQCVKIQKSITNRKNIKKWKNNILHVANLAFLIVVFFGLLNASSVHSFTVEADVKVSICGNGISEGIEQCDNEDFGGKSCKDLGFSSGELDCDQSCDLIITQCILPMIELDPVTPEIERVYKVVGNDIVLAEQHYIHPFFEYIDLDKDGKIARSEISNGLNTWKSFKTLGYRDNGCDLDRDKDCDIADISIFLYYVERDVTK